MRGREVDCHPLWQGDSRIAQGACSTLRVWWCLLEGSAGGPGVSCLGIWENSPACTLDDPPEDAVLDDLTRQVRGMDDAAKMAEMPTGSLSLLGTTGMERWLGWWRWVAFSVFDERLRRSCLCFGTA